MSAYAIHLLGRYCERMDSPRTRHVTANPVIEVDDEKGTAHVRSSYVVFQSTDGVRTDDGTWRWAERRYALDHVGDLSHHLRSG
jgi:3-phenylpropionate/cinnamic acid dioxygenase small subunit